MTAPDRQENTMKHLKTGTDSAACKLDEQYRARLCRLVEREMDRRVRRKEDPEDVVQSAFRTFYRRNTKGEFRIDSSVDLWRLLETITRHKMLKHVESCGPGSGTPNAKSTWKATSCEGRIPRPKRP